MEEGRLKRHIKKIHMAWTTPRIKTEAFSMYIYQNIYNIHSKPAGGDVPTAVSFTVPLLPCRFPFFLLIATAGGRLNLGRNIIYNQKS